MVIKNETPKETSSSTTTSVCNTEADNTSSDDSQLLQNDKGTFEDNDEDEDAGDFDCKTPENEPQSQENELKLQKEVEESNNNCLTSSWNYYYPAESYYVYEIDQGDKALGGASEQASTASGQAGPIMATAATAPVVEQEVFTSSDLPLQGPYPNLGGSGLHIPVPGGHHNDLFVNPAFAHMSFLPDGSMVGPNGEVYTPAEYFPSLLVEQPQDVPAFIPVSPQPLQESFQAAEVAPQPQQPPIPQAGVGKN